MTKYAITFKGYTHVVYASSYAAAMKMVLEEHGLG